MNLQKLSEPSFNMHSSLMIPILLTVLLQTVASQDDATVDYYVNLISEYREEAKTFRGPEDAKRYQTQNNTLTDVGSFDFIVIGAGAGGSVVANRLSAISQWNVLVIEAGQYENNLTDIPGMYTLDEFTDYNWAYTSVPQTTCCQGMADHKCPYPRGKAVGGTTVINGLMYTRGNRADFDEWESLGNPGWSYKNLLPRFITMENNQVFGDPGYHGVGGLFNVEYYRTPSPQLFAFLDANVELGYLLIDINGESQLGATATPFNTVFGRRQSAAKAYVNPALGRKNLRIVTGSYVTKILIDEDTRTAYGVLFSNGKSKFRALASREVILCAGVMESPHLLLLSGVGPKEQLKHHGIHLIQRLSGVGEHMYDHPNFLGMNFETSYVEAPKTEREYVVEFLNGRGPYAVPASNQGLGYYRLDPSLPSGVPSIELLMKPANATTALTARALRFTRETSNAVYHDMNVTSSFILYVILLHPKSHGWVRLKSSDPYDYPLISPRYFSEEEDLESMYKGIQLALNLTLNTDAFKRINTRLVGTNVPGCEKFEYASKDYYFCAIRHVTNNVYHPVGTCRMGPDSSKGDVVDSKLRVHGVQNLRVADASVFPRQLSGHPTSTIMVIGWSVSDFLVARHLFNEPDM